jgi:hypothetical protein
MYVSFPLFGRQRRVTATDPTPLAARGVRCRQATSYRATWADLAGVPEAPLAARIGVVPAQAWPWRGAGPRSGGGRADDADRRVGGDGPICWPAYHPAAPIRRSRDGSLDHSHRRAAAVDSPAVHRAATIDPQTGGGAFSSSGRTSTMLVAVVVGTTRIAAKPAVVTMERNSASVRSRPPGAFTSISRSMR